MHYQKTMEVLQRAELVLFGKPSAWPNASATRAYADTVLGSPWLVLAGAHILCRRLRWIPVAAFTFFLAMLPFADQGWQLLVTPALVLGVGTVYFGLPSLSLSASVKPENIADIRDAILSSTTDTNALNMLEAGVDVVRNTITEKLSRFTLLAGIAWGVLFWFVGTHVLAPGLPSEAIGRSLSIGIIGTIVFLCVLIAGACHSAALRAVHQSLQFALIEARYQLTSGGHAEDLKCRAC